MNSETMSQVQRPQRTPSSVSTMSSRDSLDAQVEKPEEEELMRMDEEAAVPVRSKPSRWNLCARRHLLIIGVIGLVIWSGALASFVFRGSFDSHTHHPIAESRRLTLDTAQSPIWIAHEHQVDWTDAHGEDGVFLIQSEQDLRLASVNGTNEVFVKASDIRADQLKGSPPIPATKHWISADMKYLLLASEVRPNWRHSFTAKYWVHNVEKKQTISLIPDDPEAILAHAAWAHKGHSIAFVKDNDVYVRHNMGDVERVTSDGSKNIFNGIADWVYEEEVFANDVALWWAPDGKSFAYLKTDEKRVREYPLEMFVGNGAPQQYPDIEWLKYPKPGTANPIVKLFHYNLESKQSTQVTAEGSLSDNDRLITEIKWLGPEKLFMRENNRDSVIQQTIIATPGKGAKVTQTLNISSIDGGWFEITHNTHYIPANPAHNRPDDGYIDIVISDGHLHLALFSPVDAAEPKMLTSGNWEITGGVQAIDLERGLVYFLSTKKSSTERHLSSVSMVTGEISDITSTKNEGYFSTSFSPKAGYYLLTYSGPGVPYQKFLSTNDPSFEIVLEENSAIKAQVAKYDLPTKHYSTITIDGLEMNVMELRPPNFDGSGKTKYPVLFNPYGGPASQQVHKRFKQGWEAYLVSDPALEYLVVTVDGRGTGFKGRSLRTPIRGHLGRYEAKDQIEAAKIWQAKPYTDKNKFAIWGWSFGGFLTLKVLEAASGVFQYGMAVAPVTDWRFYDSVYTERFMGLLEENQAGYEETAVTNMTAFSEAKRLLVMHGTGDDNVHYQNTLTFIDHLNQAGVENYDLHVFPDSDHSIYFHNANRQVYHRLTNWLTRAFGKRDPAGEDRSWVVPA
ncbi:dipeptidyl peptidase IV N-terminal region-domain-containing protein [Protomyces lactucae-debilis]|uniref:Dipeptidyl peptidase IV N-terminal region-domain-containing protein n=1 Tax=Protomyces lactucae-debilis TaxID=2754530 RepID=A0A1Y2FF30_PROLT|nr:dipeptidyl peptidase IV N-terminal region-domain-containing protein [Protomyces lactucae-debilis]ORY81906.1 dipeptidyl peptidase IV N-terminal region-domain-containing protein [Protomyces lactucae-debilis]